MPRLLLPNTTAVFGWPSAAGMGSVFDPVVTSGKRSGACWMDASK